MQEKYLERIERYGERQEKYEKHHKYLGYGKLLSMGLFLFCFYFVTQKADLTLIVLTILFAELYVMLWVIQNKIEEKLNYYIHLGRIYQEYVDRINGNWTSFEDTGEEFASYGHCYAMDLDIVGKNSLFQRLNTAKTYFGRKGFADALLNLQLDQDAIERRQYAVNEMSQDIKFSADFQYYAGKTRGTRKDNTLELLAALTDTSGYRVPLILRFLVMLLPVVGIVFLLVGTLLRIQFLYQSGVFVVLLMGVLWVLGSLKTMASIGNIAGARYKMTGFIRLFQILESTDFNAGELKELQEKFIHDGVKTSQAMEDLNKIIERINLRNNVFLYIGLNLFLLWDYRCTDQLNRWRDKYAAGMTESFQALGDFEQILSFANIRFIEENLCMPDIVKENRVAAWDMGHPLLSAADRVCNIFDMNDEIYIISGSNMSGKTTFLRTIGVNMVLGLNGSFVCAGKMVLPVVQIRTSMRIRDDLNEGVSTFYAELNRIKDIVAAARSGEKIIFLIDEIFKGTNSVDRIAGAIGVLENLDRLGSIGLITTHDLELCRLGDQGRVRNYSFSEYYEDQKIKFDYQLKKGRSTTTNAKFLMEMVGLLEE